MYEDLLGAEKHLVLLEQEELSKTESLPGYVEKVTRTLVTNTRQSETGSIREIQRKCSEGAEGSGLLRLGELGFKEGKTSPRGWHISCC